MTCHAGRSVMSRETKAKKAAYTYNISSNRAAGDWYWEVTNHGEIIARGLAATEALARADAIGAAVSRVDPRPENLPPYLDDPWASSPRIRAA
jgi:hypothetical protein